MSYSPATETDRAEMLAAVGAKSIEELFADVPAAVRFPKLDLPEPQSEMETLRELMNLSEANADTQHCPIFLGAGAYNHYSPAVVDAMILRGEFLTAYTPYQPEISQGTLQAIFEYQSMIARSPAWRWPTPRTMTAPPRWPRRRSWPLATRAEAPQGRRLAGGPPHVPGGAAHLHPGHGPDHQPAMKT